MKGIKKSLSAGSERPLIRFYIEYGKIWACPLITLREIVPTDQTPANVRTISKKGARPVESRNFFIADMNCVQLSQSKSRDALLDESQSMREA